MLKEKHYINFVSASNIQIKSVQKVEKIKLFPVHLLVEGARPAAGAEGATGRQFWFTASRLGKTLLSRMVLETKLFQYFHRRGID